MQNVHESEMWDNFEKQYPNDRLPKIYFKKLPILKDYTDAGLELKAGERRKFGCYICPKDELKLNVFIPGEAPHYSVPADVFFKKPKISQLLGFLIRDDKNAVLFNIDGLEYTLSFDLNGYRQFLRSDYLDQRFMRNWGVENLHPKGALVCLPRIFGDRNESAIYWEFREVGSRTSIIFKIATGTRIDRFYYPPEYQITIGTNDKMVVYKGVSCWMKKGKLHLQKG